MAMNKSQKHLLFLLGLFCFTMQACSSIYHNPFSALPDAASQREALPVINRIQQTNRSLLAFKGIGRIELTRGKDAFIARTAWIGLYPDRFRIEILAMTGRPVISLSADQDHFFYLSHIDSTYFEKTAPGATLEDLSSIPVEIEDILHFLTGRIPIQDHTIAYIQKPDSGPEVVLILEKGWTGVNQKIYLDEKKTKIYKVEIFGITGALRYRAELFDEITVDGFTLPSRMLLSNESGDSLQLRIERYFANAPVEQSMFLIPPPEGKE